MNLHQAVRYERVSAAVEVGNTTITPSAGVNTRGFKSCTFLILWGEITDAPSVKVQQSSDDGGADDYTDIAGTAVAVAADHDNKVTWVEVYNPGKHYLKPIVTRGGVTGCVVDGILAMLADADHPITQPAAVSGEFHDSKAEGTA